MITKSNLDAVAEYRKVSLIREKGAYIEIGYYDGLVTSFYEQYDGMGGHEIRGYQRAEINSVIDQLVACDWRVVR